MKRRRVYVETTCTPEAPSEASASIPIQCRETRKAKSFKRHFVLEPDPDPALAAAEAEQRCVGA